MSSPSNGPTDELAWEGSSMSSATKIITDNTDPGSDESSRKQHLADTSDSTSLRSSEANASLSKQSSSCDSSYDNDHNRKQDKKSESSPSSSSSTRSSDRDPAQVSLTASALLAADERFTSRRKRAQEKDIESGNKKLKFDNAALGQSKSDGEGSSEGTSTRGEDDSKLDSNYCSSGTSQLSDSSKSQQEREHILSVLETRIDAATRELDELRKESEALMREVFEVLCKANKEAIEFLEGAVAKDNPKHEHRPPSA